jgi:hypothetical protein
MSGFAESDFQGAIMIVFQSLLLLLVFAGQAASRPAQSDPELADPYVDGSYGISIQPPKGWSLVRQQVPETRGVTLLRMVDRVSVSRVQEIVLKRTTTTKAMAITEMLERLAGSLELESSEVKILSRQAQTIAGKPGAVLAATFMSEGVKQLRLEGIIETRPQQYFVLLYAGPAELQSKSEPLFHRVLDSVRLLSDDIDETEIAAASEAAVQWMSEITADDLEKAVRAEQYLEMRVDGEVIGVVEIQQAAYTWEKTPGVRIRERGWTFENDGRVQRLQSTMFVSNDLQRERWKTSVTMLLPAEGNKPERLENSWEEGLRDGEALLSNQTYRLDEPAKENPSLRPPKTYIPRPIVRLLPRLVGDPAKQRRLAFAAFDHQRVGFVLRIVDLKGECDAPEGVTAKKVYRIEDREGFAEPSSLYVDEGGDLLMMKAGKLTMTPGDKGALEKRFLARITKAEESMNRLEKQYQDSQQRFMRKNPAGEKKSSGNKPATKKKPG